MLRTGALKGGVWLAVQNIRLQLRSAVVGNCAKQFQSISYCLIDLPAHSNQHFKICLMVMVTKDWLAALLGLVLSLDEIERRVVSGSTCLPKCHPVTQEIGRAFVFLSI